MSERSKSDSHGAAGDRDKAPKKRATNSGGKKAERAKGGSNDVGRVLRSVYDRTLREEVPSDFLDLLGKLG